MYQLAQIRMAVIKKSYQQGFPSGSVVKNPLPKQETQIQSLIGKNPTCRRAMKLMLPQLLSLYPRNQSLQLLKPTGPRAHAWQQEKTLQWEACILQLESSSFLQLEKKPAQ